MARHKIDYGIDLGTTNSAIARMENGESVIKKTRSPQSDTLPSCVYFTMDKKGQKSIRVGLRAKNSIAEDFINALKKGHKAEEYGYIEFKRTMKNNDVHSNSNMKKPTYTSEELSAEVLKELKSIINDEDVDSVVVTVPAKFDVNEKTHTKNAAALAGFKQCELLQEPIAACYAYGVSSAEKNGFWLVFDFGGGTFDAALVKVEDGIISIIDTEGNNYLGGKNLDEAVVNKILIPKLQETYSLDSFFAEDWKILTLRQALKSVAEELRINLSFDENANYSAYDRDTDFGEDDNGETIEPDFEISRNELSEVIMPIYQEAVDICKQLLKRNNLQGSDLATLVLVGGPTFSPIVRDMLRQQITDKVDTHVDPMTVVARGAALYASTLDRQLSDFDIKSETGATVVKLNVNYESTTVEGSEWISVSLDEKETLDEVQIQFERSDKAFYSEKIDVTKQGNVIELYFQKGKPNSFKINCFCKQGQVECFPSEITIIQGTVVGKATLPYDIAIGIWSNDKKKAVVDAIDGLQRNQILPAIGTNNKRRTSSQLRPGIPDDKLVIPIYQVDDGGRGKSVTLYDEVCAVEITGDDVDQLIPADSDVHLTIKVDQSEMMSMEVYFPTIDFTIQKQIDTNNDTNGKKRPYGENEFRNDLRSANKQLDMLDRNGIDVVNFKDELGKLDDESNNSNDWMKLRNRLRLQLRQIEDLDSQTEWQRLEKQLREEFDRLEKSDNKLGDDKTHQAVSHLRTQTDKVIRSKDITLGKELLEQIRQLFLGLNLLEITIAMFYHWDDDFDVINWKDRSRARSLINKGAEIISNNPSADKLRPIAIQVIELLPDSERGKVEKGGWLQ